MQKKAINRLVDNMNTVFRSGSNKDWTRLRKTDQSSIIRFQNSRGSLVSSSFRSAARTKIASGSGTTSTPKPCTMTTPAIPIPSKSTRAEIGADHGLANAIQTTDIKLTC